MEFHDIVNFERYMDDAARAEVVARSRNAMRSVGAVVLEDFVTPAALEEMVQEARAAYVHAYRRQALYTAYLPSEATGDAMHPTRRLHPYALDAVANDRLNPNGTLQALYRNEAFIRFVADILEEPELHPLADPILGLTLTYLKPGDEHGWHFDRNDFVVSLLLQQSEEGGVFEFAPFVRSDDDPNFDAVAAIMDGDTRGLHRIALKSGMLALFEGRRSLHHVSQVRGNTTRIIALLSYDRVPNMFYEEAVHLRTFGRTPLAK